jgi:hypothetical protein
VIRLVGAVRNWLASMSRRESMLGRDEIHARFLRFADDLHARQI